MDEQGYLWSSGRQAITRLRPYVEQRTLLVVLLVSGLGWAFIELADEVVEGSTHAYDEAILLALRNPADHSDPLGPGWIEELGRDFTALGGIGVLTLLTLATAGLLWFQGRWRAMWLLLAAVGSGVIVSTLVKQGFDRPRPDLVPHGSIVYTASFPSGHSMMAAITYLTLGVLMARFQARRVIRVYILAVAVFITVAVGLSRVYLGVHWPTDVLAGWSAGAGWALLCWLVAVWLQNRGAIEPEEPQVDGTGEPG